MLLLEPRVALLDEIDSGLDIDALKVVAKGIRQGRSKGLGVVLITHYQRILDYVTPDVVHVFKEGRVARTGGPELALELEAKGYEGVTEARAAGGA
jgi:Fe-S cluster assembly ATP-binding protein